MFLIYSWCLCVFAGLGQKLVEYFAFCIWKSVWNKSRCAIGFYVSDSV